MSQNSQDDNLEKYRSYIQRRRVGSVPENDPVQDPLESNRFSTETDSIFSTEKSSLLLDDKPSESEPGAAETYTRTYTESRSSTPGRSEPDIYRRLYGQNRRVIRTPSYSSAYRGGLKGHAEIEDNRTTLLAIKIIKQSLACFAILGIIVLLQQRDDTVGALEFIKKHVVDNNIDMKNILAGIEKIAKECTRILGGSP